MLKPFSPAHLDRAHKYQVHRFQWQLKLESVMIFSVSRFLLSAEMCVGHARRCPGPGIAIPECGANNEQHSSIFFFFFLPFLCLGDSGGGVLPGPVTHQEQAPPRRSQITRYKRLLITHSEQKTFLTIRFKNSEALTSEGTVSPRCLTPGKQFKPSCSATTSGLHFGAEESFWCQGQRYSFSNLSQEVFIDFRARMDARNLTTFYTHTCGAEM